MNCSPNASGIAFHQVVFKAEEEKLKSWRTSGEVIPLFGMVLTAKFNLIISYFCQ